MSLPTPKEAPPPNGSLGNMFVAVNANLLEVKMDQTASTSRDENKEHDAE